MIGRYEVVHRLENHHLVAGLDHGQNGRCQRLGAAGGDHHLGHRIERKAVPAPVMGRDRLPQLREAHHRRILVVAVHHRVRRGPPDILRSGMVGKTLAEIDGVVVAGELRHRLEDRDGKIREIPCSWKSWQRSAAALGRQSRGLPAQYPPGEMLVVGKARGLRRQRGRHRSLAGAAGKHHLLALRIRNILRDRRSRAERRPRRDRLPPRPRSARVRRPEDSGPPPFPSIPLPASNRAPDDPGPPLKILPPIQAHLDCAYSIHKTGLDPCGMRAVTSEFS